MIWFIIRFNWLKFTQRCLSFHFHFFFLLFYFLNFFSQFRFYRFSTFSLFFQLFSDLLSLCQILWWMSSWYPYFWLLIIIYFCFVLIPTIWIIVFLVFAVVVFVYFFEGTSPFFKIRNFILFFFFIFWREFLSWWPSICKGKLFIASFCFFVYLGVIFSMTWSWSTSIAQCSFSYCSFLYFLSFQFHLFL